MKTLIPIKYRQSLQFLPELLLQETGQTNIAPLKWTKSKHDVYKFNIDYGDTTLPVQVDFENMNLSPQNKQNDLPEIYWDYKYAYNVVYHIYRKTDQYTKTTSPILYTILSTVIDICLDFLKSHTVDLLCIKPDERLNLATGKISNKKQLYKMYAVEQVPNITGFIVDFYKDSTLLIKQKDIKEIREMNKQYYNKIALKEEIKKQIISELLSFDTFLGDLYSELITIDPRAEIVEDNNEKVIKIGDDIIIQVTTEFDSNKNPMYVIYEYDKKDPNVVKNKFLSTKEVLKFVQDNFDKLKPKELMKEDNKHPWLSEKDLPPITLKYIIPGTVIKNKNGDDWEIVEVDNPIKTATIRDLDNYQAGWRDVSFTKLMKDYTLNANEIMKESIVQYKDKNAQL